MGVVLSRGRTGLLFEGTDCQKAAVDHDLSSLTIHGYFFASHSNPFRRAIGVGRSLLRRDSGASRPAGRLGEPAVTAARAGQGGRGKEDLEREDRDAGWNAVRAASLCGAAGG